VTHLGITRPACSTLSPNPEWLLADATTLYGGEHTTCSGGILTVPTTGGAELVMNAHPTSQLGNDAVLVAGAIWSLDNSSTSTERLYRLVPDGSGAFASTPWDTGSSYTGATDALAWDGIQLILANYASATGSAPTIFYAVSTAAPSPAMVIGTNDTLREISGMAIDATWIYAVATVGGEEGLFRLRRSELGNPAATPETLYTGDDMTDRNAAIFFDDPAAPTVLYFRTYAGPNKVFALLQPDSATPRLLGPLLNLGRNADNSMALDPTGRSLYVYETTTTTAGNYVRID
jgi:hypothetical protein